jgi:hypothetical protein
MILLLSEVLLVKLIVSASEKFPYLKRYGNVFTVPGTSQPAAV